MATEAKPLLVHLTASDHEALKLIAERRGQSMSGVIRTWVRREMKRIQKEENQ